MNYYRELLRQSTRIEPFRRAINATVGPGDRVLEVGTGLGTYAFFAADAGAEKVWAVEGEAVLHVAETVAKLNGYGDRVRFIRGWIPQVALPDRATVLVFEDFPPRLLDARIFRLLGRLREKYLEPDARFVPDRAILKAAPVDADAGVVLPLLPLGGSDETAYGIDWAPTRDYVANTVHHVTIPAEAITAPPAVVSDVRFRDAPGAEDLGGTVRWTPERDSRVNGIAYWFDLELAAGEVVSNAPGASPGSWGQLFLPLDPPLSLRAGQAVTVGIRPERLEDGAPGWLSWRAAAEGTEVSGHEFASAPASFGDLYERSPDAIPRLSERGRIAGHVLRLADGKRSVSEIAEHLKSVFSSLNDAEAVGWVVDSLKGKTEVQAPPDPNRVS